jgi:hypothetical protein
MCFGELFPPSYIKVFSLIKYIECKLKQSCHVYCSSCLRVMNALKTQCSVLEQSASVVTRRNY